MLMRHLAVTDLGQFTVRWSHRLKSLSDLSCHVNVGQFPGFYDAGTFTHSIMVVCPGDV